ncbi:condensation domain-containing protein [Umezawaea sp. Da 62-37]|uniref:condensation domain-containing protein n=1 Tax=Umezawaea sp. Da 62-37 TaxID=3075927 RepID=UPI0028F7227F|nr:condensation domain-containing protein [Umezawaea sp. Da 62-37]WNV84704.1 condensation domain-containing protein [Umezawaea sp. Da 62-37]
MGNAATRPERVLARIWQDVLGVDRVDEDGDFFSLGGDSLLALKVIGAAAEEGLDLTLVDLFRSPTVRGMCAALGADRAGPDDAGDLLAPEDRALVPADAEDAYPASRLQLGLIYETLLSNGDNYHTVVSRVVNRPLDADALVRALAVVSGRHPALRTRFDLVTFSEAMQVVQWSARIPVEFADHRGLAPDVEAARYEEVMTGSLKEVFDPESVPLVRVHAAALDEGRFRFSHAFHHSLMDGWSESIFTSEVVRAYAADLDGTPLDLGTPAPMQREHVRLERAALRDAASRAHFDALRPHLATEEASGEPRYRKIGFPLPHDAAAALVERSAAWGVPLKSLMLAVHAAAVAAFTGTTAPVVGVPVGGRPEVPGADLTIGLFLNYLPLRLPLDGTTWRAAADAALAGERALLPHRRFPDSEVRRLLNRRPFDSAFNYVRFHARHAALADGLLDPEEDMRERADFPIRIEAIDNLPSAGVRVEITVDVAKHGDGAPEELRGSLLAAVDGLVGPPSNSVVPLGATGNRSRA